MKVMEIIENLSKFPPVHPRQVESPSFFLAEVSFYEIYERNHLISGVRGYVLREDVLISLSYSILEMGTYRKVPDAESSFHYQGGDILIIHSFHISRKKELFRWKEISSEELGLFFPGSDYVYVWDSLVILKPSWHFKAEEIAKRQEVDWAFLFSQLKKMKFEIRKSSEGSADNFEKTTQESKECRDGSSAFL